MKIDLKEELNELTKEKIISLILAYDLYIQDANEEDWYADGWRPVCLSEYLNNEFQEDKK